MRYTVVWKPAAKRQLAEIWLSEPNRRAVTAAADAIDAALRLWPHACGESRGDRFRLVIEGPLGAFYAVSEEDRRVTVFYFRHLSTQS